VQYFTDWRRYGGIIANADVRVAAAAHLSDTWQRLTRVAPHAHRHRALHYKTMSYLSYSCNRRGVAREGAPPLPLWRIGIAENITCLLPLREIMSPAHTHNVPTHSKGVPLPKERFSARVLSLAMSSAAGSTEPLPSLTCWYRHEPGSGCCCCSFCRCLSAWPQTWRGGRGLFFCFCSEGSRCAYQAGREGIVFWFLQ